MNHGERRDLIKKRALLIHPYHAPPTPQEMSQMKARAQRINESYAKTYMQWIQERCAAPMIGPKLEFHQWLSLRFGFR